MTESQPSSPGKQAVRLPTSFKERIWGSSQLSPWYPDSDLKIGEVWFEADLPLLVKFIFTTEKLSVQVHPNDEFAAKHENSRGKTEMWHILRTDAGAQIALGFKEAITPERLREASLSGEIEKLLNWVDVKPGETYFVPAGTVHAIGAGIALCEVQQHSDVTYRLYDYGRRRELHLDKGVQVCDTGAHECGPTALPVKSPYFQTELLVADGPVRIHPDRFELLIVLEGQGAIEDEPYRPGEAWHVGRGGAAIEPSVATKFLRTWAP